MLFCSQRSTSLSGSTLGFLAHHLIGCIPNQHRILHYKNPPQSHLSSWSSPDVEGSGARETGRRETGRHDPSGRLRHVVEVSAQEHQRALLAPVEVFHGSSDGIRALSGAGIRAQAFASSSRRMTRLKETNDLLRVICFSCLWMIPLRKMSSFPAPANPRLGQSCFSGECIASLRALRATPATELLGPYQDLPFEVIQSVQKPPN